MNSISFICHDCRKSSHTESTNSGFSPKTNGIKKEGNGSADTFIYGQAVVDNLYYSLRQETDIDRNYVQLNYNNKIGGEDCAPLPDEKRSSKSVHSVSELSSSSPNVSVSLSKLERSQLDKTSINDNNKDKKDADYDNDNGNCLQVTTGSKFNEYV